METMREKYEKEGFSPDQIDEIEIGLQKGLKVSHYAKKEFLAIQMHQIRLGLEQNLAVVKYAKPEYDWFQMEEIREGLKDGLDVSKYADPKLSYEIMRQIRKGLAQGIELPYKQGWSAGILREVRKAMLAKVNITKYIREGYKKEQLNEIRKAIENGINVDPDSIFDIQIKRLHEYKRQLLNVLQILYMYNKIKENPNLDIPPRTFVFAAKASAGYFMAKQIIRLIVAVSNTINNDPVAREKIKVVFVEDYRVSLAEIIIPPADISEQISIAGKEASGTGNMKLMINGAVTLGTLDGANVEIFENVGEDNIFLFGLKSHEVDELWRRGYSPLDYVRTNPELQKVLDMLTSNVLGARFDDIAKSLLTNAYGTADAYMTLADFDSYVKAQERVSATYVDKYKFGDMSLVNIAKSGVFSSDRAIMEYAKNIWHCR